MICWCNSGTKVVGATNHYLIGIKAHSVRWNLDLTLPGWPDLRLDRLWS